MIVKRFLTGLVAVSTLLASVAFAHPACPATSALKQASINTAEKIGADWVTYGISPISVANHPWFVGVAGTPAGSSSEAIRLGRASLAHVGGEVYEDSMTTEGQRFYACAYTTDNSGVFVVALTPLSAAGAKMMTLKPSAGMFRIN